MTQQSADLPEEAATDPNELADDGAGLGFGEKNTFEPEEEPDAEAAAAGQGDSSPSDEASDSTDRG